jgi:hypothetical protein
MDSSRIADRLLEAQVLVRTRDSGVHVGRLAEVGGECLVLTGPRRIWSWKGGALDCYELAEFGPDECKLSARTKVVVLSGWLEIHPLSEAAERKYGL